MLQKDDQWKVFHIIIFKNSFTLLFWDGENLLQETLQSNISFKELNPKSSSRSGKPPIRAQSETRSRIGANSLNPESLFRERKVSNKSLSYSNPKVLSKIDKNTIENHESNFPSITKSKKFLIKPETFYVEKNQNLSLDSASIDDIYEKQDTLKKQIVKMKLNIPKPANTKRQAELLKMNNNIIDNLKVEFRNTPSLSNIMGMPSDYHKIPISKRRTINIMNQETGNDYYIYT